MDTKRTNNKKEKKGISMNKQIYYFEKRNDP